MQFQLLPESSRDQNIDGNYPRASTGLPDTGDIVDGKTLGRIVNRGSSNKSFLKAAGAGAGVEEN